MASVLVSGKCVVHEQRRKMRSECVGRWRERCREYGDRGVGFQGLWPLPCLLRMPGRGEGMAWRLGQQKPRGAAVLVLARVAVCAQTGVERGSSSSSRRRSSRSGGGGRIGTTSRTGGIGW